MTDMIDCVDCKPTDPLASGPEGAAKITMP